MRWWVEKTPSRNIIEITVPCNYERSKKRIFEDKAEVGEEVLVVGELESAGLVTHCHVKVYANTFLECCQALCKFYMF